MRAHGKAKPASRKPAAVRKTIKAHKAAKAVKAPNAGGGGVPHTKGRRHHESAKTKRIAARKAAATRRRHAAAKRRALARDLGYDGCAVQAIAASLWLATGIRAPDSELRDLFAAAGGRPAGGVYIPDLLEVITLQGLAGCNLASFTAAHLDEADEPGLVLGLDLPGPHTVLTAAASPHSIAWLTWGETCDPDTFPAAVIEEAWRLDWGSPN